MQKFRQVGRGVNNPIELRVIGTGADLTRKEYGWRAERLHRLLSFGFPVPKSIGMSIDSVRQLTKTRNSWPSEVLSQFDSNELIAVRASPSREIIARVGASLNVGLNSESAALMADEIGEQAAHSIYAEFVRSYAIEVKKLEPEPFDLVFAATDCPIERLHTLKARYRTCSGDEFPESREEQLFNVCVEMYRRWNKSNIGPLRQGDDEFGLGLIFQSMVFAFGGDIAAHGSFTSVDENTGRPQPMGSLSVYSKDGQIIGGGSDPSRELLPDQEEKLNDLSNDLTIKLQDPQRIEFAYANKKIWLLDAVPARRSVAAAIRIAVDLQKDGVITKGEALQRVPARSLAKTLHPQVKPNSVNKLVTRGIPASPGAAAGVIAFSSKAAERFVASGERCILVRAETGPEDFRGMHIAQGVLTGRGGSTSHAAVVARQLGVPCVVGASEILISAEGTKTVLHVQGGLKFSEGDSITVDGATGEVFDGQVELVEPKFDEYFETYLAWADEFRVLKVRANADTVEEVEAALKFKADGIGLCRTEHMFFEDTQLAVMRRMLFEKSNERRKDVLSKLVQMQTADLTNLLRVMGNRPACIRLFDPPLHEFLPSSEHEMETLAEAFGQDIDAVRQRAEELREFNPMLGMRGVRVGIIRPEIYETQARAIFSAAVAVRGEGLDPHPEIMIPLVSANREVEVVRGHVERIADRVRQESGVDFHYRLGVMVETPRAALRAGDLAKNTDFLSFGTNDLTQMAFGLSRDDAQRFIGAYINRGIFPNDPFRTLDQEGVGELLQTAALRGRKANGSLELSICGEHGGDPESIRFCGDIGFDYVSCSPFRVPIARLAAAQHAIACH